MINPTENRATRAKVMALGLLLAALMAASLMLTASQARASTAFTVNSTEDHSDAVLTVGACDTGYQVPGSGGGQEAECTLRAAIEQANYTPGADTINFAIPGSGVKTISPASALPDITGPVTINGYSQPGAEPNEKARGTDAVLKIELSGAELGYVDGLVIDTANSTIKGLVINRFKYSGIFLNAGAVGSRIEGNFIGTDPSGTQDLGNHDDGVTVVDSRSNTVGGASLATRNLISGNNDSGVDLHSANNQVRGNLIGTQRDGNAPLGNGTYGVRISGLSSTVTGNTVAGNTVAFNREAGVEVFLDTRGNSVISNSIFDNAEEGIDLRSDFGESGQTANDPGDADTGPNGLQNKPVVRSAKTGDRTTTINARLNSTPNRTFKIQFFSNPSGNEGKKFIGQKSVSTDGSGNVVFSFSPAQKEGVGRTVTATATNPAGSTSEFSAPRTVASP